MKNKKIKESELQKMIIDYMRLKGHYVWKSGGGLFFSEYKGKTRAVRMGLRGCADIIGILKTGHWFACECKTGYNKPTPEQLNFLSEIRSRGGLAIWVKSLDEVVKQLKELR
jgi:hypothetical protein